ncbi:HET-domain-containing protein [Lepidopterella palustris CBS 459.81]|uniref:HET-domain-containing protein n=1 Tax=Lepidopterella palustris CBS 459.81 TaxID=1314670 RepID=A0A8E2JFQ6_9PEZI|nr:HET-domain-containing protein [Lepidopterella palustris CBS 459.81]
MSLSLLGSTDISLSKIYTEKVIDDFIRVLELEPGNEGDPIVCNLRTVSLTDAEDTYEAISYVWGDPNDLVGILCNNLEHHITVSLALALRTIRHATERQVLWADAICINQDDEEEKRHQVKQMGRVYESAKRVVVYLGPDADRIAEGCFDLIKDFNRYWGRGLQQYKNPLDIPISTPYPFSVDSRRWEDIATLSKMPWFDRLWVVQEAGLAKDCVMLWGKAGVGFAEVMELVEWLRCRPDFSQPICPQVVLKWSDIFLQNQCTLGNKSTWRTDLPLSAWFSNTAATIPKNESFIEVLRTGRKLKATDPRDRVYGFLGSLLALTDDGLVIVEPDYAKSAEEVYLEIGYALLRHPRETSFLLGAVDHSSPAHVLAEGDWPSWVPRWDQGYWTVPLAVPYNWYCSGGPKRAFSAHVQPGKLLAIQCLNFDRLSWVSEPLSENNFCIDSANWDERFRKCGKSTIECLWETTLCSCQHASNDLEDTFMLTLCREYPATQVVKASGINMSILRTDFAKYRRLMQKAAALPLRPGADAELNNSSSKRVVRFANKIGSCYNRRLAHTEAGRLVLTPRFAEENDVCCVIPGASVPYILRQSSEDGIYHLVGDCYIYGVMRGEITQQAEEGKYKLETILLK